MRGVKVSFYCPPAAYTRYTFDGSSLEAGVGGSESALINLAQALSARGNEIVVFCQVPSVRRILGVTYTPASNAIDHDCDVFVLFRFFAEWPAGLACLLRVLWSHDLPTPDAPYLMHRSLEVVDRIFAVSDFHAGRLRSFANQHGLGRMNGRLAVGGNGVDTHAYARKREKVRHGFIYCSVPDRGLDHLLLMWPAIRNRLCDATLVVTGGWRLWGLPDPQDRRTALPGILDLGVVPRRQLVKHQLEAELHLHPCPLYENYCLSARECQAAGTPSVTTAFGALPSTIQHDKTGVIVQGLPGTRRFHQAFVSEAVELARDRERLATIAAQARTHAQLHDYHHVAARWEAQLLAWLGESASAPQGLAADE